MKKFETPEIEVVVITDVVTDTIGEGDSSIPEL